MEWDSGKPISLGFRPVLIFAFLAVAFFMAGPQMGSLDLDHDGIPETAVAVSSSRPVVNLSKSLQTDQRKPSAATLALACVLIDSFGCNQHVSTDGHQNTSHYYPLYVVLRC
jgi:hypothetical protein